MLLCDAAHYRNAIIFTAIVNNDNLKVICCNVKRKNALQTMSD